MLRTNTECIDSHQSCLPINVCKALPRPNKRYCQKWTTDGIGIDDTTPLHSIRNTQFCVLSPTANHGRRENPLKSNYECSKQTMDKIHACYNYKLEHVLINDRYGEYNLKSMSEFIPSWRTTERFQWYLFWYACVRVWPSFLLLSHCDGVICGYTLLKRLLTGLPCLIL